MAGRGSPVVCLRADVELAEMIDALAAQLGVSRSEVLRRALTEYIKATADAARKGEGDNGEKTGVYELRQ